MPTRITHFLHKSDVTGAQAVGTAFNTTARHTHSLLVAANAPDFQLRANYLGIMQGLQIYLTTLAGGATSVTVRITQDAAGDVVCVPDTTATLATGVTTAATGSAMFKIDLPIHQDLGGPGNGTFYVFVKVNAGTAVFSGSMITWME
jgi:hypothetical protein